MVRVIPLDAIMLCTNTDCGPSVQRGCDSVVVVAILFSIYCTSVFMLIITVPLQVGNVMYTFSVVALITSLLILVKQFMGLSV